MTTIPITDDLRLRQIPDNWVVERRHVSKKTGKITWDVAGYYATMGGALRRLLHDGPPGGYVAASVGALRAAVDEWATILSRAGSAPHAPPQGHDGGDHG